jgi:hypothetical protein
VPVSNHRSNQAAAKVHQVPGGIDANDDFQMVLLQKITSMELLFGIKTGIASSHRPQWH